MTTDDALAVPTPELDKMRAIQPVSQAIGKFLEWHAERGTVLCRYISQGVDMDEVGWHPQYQSIERLLAAFFDIDLDKAEAEKLAVLAALRA
jgi:hypothetical protein